QDVGAGRPHSEGEQRRVEDRRLTSALAVEQGGRDAARRREPSHEVAKGSKRLVERPLAVGRRRLRGYDAPPERASVVATLLALGTSLAVSRAPHVDDVRVGGPDVFQLDAQLLAELRQVVGDEDVCGGDQLEQGLTALGRRQ